MEICNGISADCNGGGYLASREFGMRIAQLRRKLAVRRHEDVWPADVARHMKISRSAYHQWENGDTQPKDIGTYERLAAFLGVKLTDLGVNISEMKLGARAEPVAKGKRVTTTPEERKGGEG